MRIFAVAFIASSLLAGAALAQALPAGVKVANGAYADAAGKALYTYDRDVTPGKSACNGVCASSWPPLVAPAGAQASGDWTIITRDDGARQWAYKGKPVYTFSRDAAGKPGGGEGVTGWRLAKP